MTEATLTLTNFLLARLAEDEADAGCEAGLIEARAAGSKPAHKAFTPTRVLAEVKAKRRIVRRCDLADTRFAGFVLRDLASVYADHPDFREEWRA